MESIEKLKLAFPTGEVQNQFVESAQRFIQFSGRKSSYAREDVLRYLRHLEEKEKKPSYRRFVFYTLKRYFEENSWPWELKKRDLPAIIEEDLTRPALFGDQVKDLITKARQKCEPRELAVLAVDTTYGPRRVELSLLSRPKIDLDGRKLPISTRKKGTPRVHLIPEEIVPFLDAYPNREMTPDNYTMIWRGIAERCRIKRQPRDGWHSLRRGLCSDLIDTNLSPVIVYRFLRWKIRGLPMLDVYFQTKVEKIDEQVFEVHPWLKFWE